jgi:dihydropteroate synthase
VNAAPLLRVADLSRYSVIGIVNVTPDSFSDGGRFAGTDAAVAHGRELARAGAAIIDVGGESTRPGAGPVAEAEELRRVVPVVAALAADGLRVSIDTTKAAVAAAALDAGAVMVNDISGGAREPAILRVVAEAGAAYVAMHMRGTPQTMLDAAIYDDVVAEAGAELRARVDAALEAGIAPESILADPGIGFAKDAEQSRALLRSLPLLAAAVGMPLLIGASRKSVLAPLVGDDLAARDDGTLAVSVWAFVNGAAAVRVHDVESSQRAVALLEVLARATPEGVAA